VGAAQDGDVRRAERERGGEPVAGPMRFRPDAAGRTIQRFTAFERFIHWLTAVSFVWLSLTGLNLVFGRYLLQPLVGDDQFAFTSGWLKLSHNSVGFAFIAGLAVMVVQWFTRNLPSRVDIAWFRALGGMFGGPHPPAQKFNAGQKMIYWVAAFGGSLISLTGMLLLVPFYFLASAACRSPIVCTR
jgi:formate dehydrogenase subunit gamma